MRPIHLRMARAALGWTLKDLADRAKVNLNTISRYEAGHEILTGTMRKIEDALRGEGIVFVDEDEDFEPAIRLRKLALVTPAFHAAENPFSNTTRRSRKKPKTARK
jgi:transcriptional regulator with XRE-family HTH domain